MLRHGTATESTGRPPQAAHWKPSVEEGSGAQPRRPRCCGSRAQEGSRYRQGRKRQFRSGLTQQNRNFVAFRYFSAAKLNADKISCFVAFLLLNCWKGVCSALFSPACSSFLFRFVLVDRSGSAGALSGLVPAGGGFPPRVPSAGAHVPPVPRHPTRRAVPAICRPGFAGAAKGAGSMLRHRSTHYTRPVKPGAGQAISAY